MKSACVGIATLHHTTRNQQLTLNNKLTALNAKALALYEVFKALYTSLAFKTKQKKLAMKELKYS